MTMSPAYLFAGFAAAAVLWVSVRAGVHWAIRRSLAAPRIVEQSSPAALGLAFASVRIPTVRGRHLHGWFVPPASAAGSRVPAAIVMHGWGGNCELMLPLCRPLHASGFATLFVDARCHGRSDDDSFASLPRFAEDVRAALGWLGARDEVDPTRVALVGHSVGAGAVLLAAVGRPEVSAVVSISAFAHPADMMRRWLAARRVPVVIGRYILAYVQDVIGHRFDDIAPVRSIARLSCPVLLIHGDRDPVVPIEDADRLYAARADERVERLILKGDHEAFDDVERELGALSSFLRRATGLVPGGTPIGSEAVFQRVSKPASSTAARTSPSDMNAPCSTQASPVSSDTST